MPEDGGGTADGVPRILEKREKEEKEDVLGPTALNPK